MQNLHKCPRQRSNSWQQKKVEAGMQSPFEKSRSAQLQFEKYNRRVFEKKKNSKKLVGSTGKLGSTALRSDNCLDEKQIAT